MEKKNIRRYVCILLRIFILLFCMAGFVYQTFGFLFLYWTYPTVVDIQQTSPSYVEVPAFTFCSRAGYIYENICSEFDFNPCSKSQKFFGRISDKYICGDFAPLCINGTNGRTLPPGFSMIMYGKFMERYQIKTTDFPKLYVPLKEYLNCSIHFAGNCKPCNMDHVLGSFYTQDILPQFCFTIYSKWGNPDKKREMVPKGATMKLHFFLNVSRQPLNAPHASLYESGAPGSLFNPPRDASVQLAVHSPYFLPSPYLDGSSFLVGRNYQLRITLSEKHLLPFPYQTNCTDYMTPWRKRGGKAPINQLSVIQECRVNKTYEKLGCIPVTLDYPHPYNICKKCPEVESEECPYKEPPNNCSVLADDYNQQCDSLVYHVQKEAKSITYFKKMDTIWAESSDGLRITLPEHDCEGSKFWRPECSTIDIDIPFDRFEITNMTYNPKYESLELLSVIGGYLGMWLGFSLLTVVNIIEKAVKMFRKNLINKKRTRIRAFNTSHRPPKKDNRKNDQFLRSSYHVF